MSVLGSEEYRRALAVWLARPGDVTEAQREVLEAGRAEVPGQRAGCYPLPSPVMADDEPVSTPRASG